MLILWVMPLVLRFRFDFLQKNIFLLTKEFLYYNILLSIKSVLGTAPLITQQPAFRKVLKAERWDNMLFNPSHDGFFLALYGIFL